MDKQISRKAYTQKIMELYSLVAVLSEKNGGKVLRLRHKKLGKDMILRSYPAKFGVYGYLSRLRCENLPEIYDVTECEDGQIVLEEYIEGLSVAQVMETGQYRYRGAKAVITGVCKGLEILHAQGYVHRDVKPENVLIGENGRVVLVDFNASRQIKQQCRDTVILGTVGYASPEQLGIAQSDARTDIYAAGVLLNVMLTGKHPSQQIATGKGGRIVKKATAIHPDDRFQTAEKLANAL